MKAISRQAWVWVLPVATIAALLGAWQLVTAMGVLRPDQFPTMTSTFEALGGSLTTPPLWLAIWPTVQGWFTGLLIASVLAIVIGSALAFNDFAYRSAASIIEIFKAVPAIAILPLVILVLGSTFTMKVFLVAFGVFWPLVIQVIYGVRSMDPTVLDTARALGVKGMRRFFVVTIPSAAPYVVTGLRIASASALILSVVSELVGGAEGIGRVILIARNGGLTSYPVMYAYILVSGFLGIILTGVFFLIEKKAMHWHESQRNITSNEGVVPR
jgi:ABC-type nitrate/sulfonate/bicarbonate transport system permease component